MSYLIFILQSEQPDASQLLITLDHVPTHSHPSSRNRSPSSVGPMRPRINEKRSPYGPYLSPPSDTSGWVSNTFILIYVILHL